MGRISLQVMSICGQGCLEQTKTLGVTLYGAASIAIVLESLETLPTIPERCLRCPSRWHLYPGLIASIL